jgi:hypothetical protein
MKVEYLNKDLGIEALPLNRFLQPECSNKEFAGNLLANFVERKLISFEDACKIAGMSTNWIEDFYPEAKVVSE